MSEDLTPAELLEKGAAYIEEHGLHQGDFWPGYLEIDFSTQGAFTAEVQRARTRGLPACAIGSLIVNDDRDGDGTDTWPAREALADSLGEAIPEWNDTPGRTAAEVADAMRACATNLRAAS